MLYTLVSMTQNISLMRTGTLSPISNLMQDLCESCVYMYTLMEAWSLSKQNRFLIRNAYLLIYGAINVIFKNKKKLHYAGIKVIYLIMLSVIKQTKLKILAM